jgi:tetratricopeptide (TPR) repeat protein
MSQYAEGSEIAGRFVIETRIGEGGMGEVYRAVQTSLDRVVALKVLRDENAFTARARRRFAREARSIARLNHPHIASVFDFGVDDDEHTLWLAMEYIEGVGMGVMRKEPVDVVRLMSLTDQILSALSAAHARDIIHRDLKPSNVLLTRDDDGREIIKLVDFGLAARHQGDSLDLTNAPGISEAEDESERVILGTPRYMAPEIFKRAPADPRVDLYALGVILFEIIAGSPPFPGDDPRKIMKAHLKAPIPQLVSRNGSLPAELERFVYTLLAKDPARRFQEAATARDKVAAIIGEYSFVPWVAMGPRAQEASTFRLGGASSQGPMNHLGGQTVAPAAMLGGHSKFGAVAAQEAPLVGRARERRVLEERLRAALRSGRGSLIFVDGEAGVGKSRLLDWVRVRVAEAGVMTAVRGGFTRTSGGISGVRHVLEQLLGVQDFPGESVAPMVASRLRRWDFSEEEIDLCVRVMRPPADENDLGEMLGSERTLADQERVFSMIERVLRRAADERPLLIILEDIHDAGESTIGLLEHLAIGLHLTPSPIVIAASMRAEELEDLPKLMQSMDRLTRFDSEDVVRLTIPRMPLDEAAELVLKLTPLDDALADRIAQRAEGNPLHMRQILQFLQEAGKLEYTSGRWQLLDGVHLTREIPDEVADLMRYRAAQVCRQYIDPEAMRALLDRCAVLGARFSYRLLRAMIVAEPGEPWLGNLDAVLEELLNKGVLREVGASGEDMLEFDYGMMRDVLLTDLSGRRAQRVLHQMAAEAKIEVWGERINERALEIAHHYQKAKEPRGVYRYTLKAARVMLAACELRQAMALFREAEELDKKLDMDSAQSFGPAPTTSTALTGAQVALHIADLERRLGEYESSRAGYRKLVSSSQTDIALWARWGLGELSLRQGDYDDAVSWFDSARREAMSSVQFGSPEHAEDAAAVDARGLLGLGTIALGRGDLNAALLTLEEALDRAQKNQDKLLESDALRALGEVAWRKGEVDRADVYRRRAFMLAESFGDREGIAQSLLYSAAYLVDAGQPAEAQARAETARDTFEELGKRHHVAHCLMILGAIAWNRGDNKEAAKTYRQAHRFFEMFRDRRGLTECKYQLAALALSIKRLSDTQTLIRDALEGFRAMGDRNGEANCWLIVGRLERELEHHAKAQRTFQEALTVYEELGDVRLRVCALAWLALARFEAEDYEAHATLDALSEALGRTHVTAEPLAVALERLSEHLTATEPMVAMEFDAQAERIWQELGRPIKVES